MANNGYGTFTKRQTTESEILDLLEEANEKYFGGMLKIVYQQDDESILVTIDGERVFLCWLDKEGTELGWRHGYASQVANYIDGFLGSYIVDRIGGYVTDDGHDEILDPDFYKRLPTYRDYVKKIVRVHKNPLVKFSVYRWIIELDKRDFPAVFLKLIKGK